MSFHPDFRRSATERTLQVRTRADLQLVPVAFSGQSAYVARDPLTLDVYHLSAEEGMLLKALRQPTSLAALERKFAEWFAPRQATIAQLQQFINQLWEFGLLVSQQPGQGAELIQRGQTRRRQHRFGAAMHLLAIRLGGVDAKAIIDPLYAGVGFLFTPWAFVAASALVLWAAITLLAGARQVFERLPALAELTQPQFWLLWFVAVAVVKLLHELGHALCCRHFGGRCREIGVMLLGFVPTLYCDVTDVWRLPNKRHRMAVSAAGMFVELVVAAAAALLWWYTRPGLLNSFCLSLTIVCSVGTLLVNANPLLRYDGYFLLADWFEIPNLAERSRGILAAAWKRWLLGETTPDDGLATPRMRAAMATYAVASKIYLAAVLVGIFTALMAAARPLQMENLIYLLAAATAAGLCTRPVLAVWRVVRNPLRRQRIRWFRFLLTGVLCGAVLIGAWYWPIQRQAAAPVTLVPARGQPVFAAAAGHLEWAVEPGAWVQQGDVIARLVDPDFALQLAKTEGTVKIRQLRYDQLRTVRIERPPLARQLPAAAAELADAQAQLDQQRKRAEQLIVRAPQAGRIVPPPDRIEVDRDEAMLTGWTGSPLDPRNRGAWIEPGVPLAVIVSHKPRGPATTEPTTAATGFTTADHPKWLAWAAVDPADIAAVESGQHVRISLASSPTRQLTGRVRHVTRRATEAQATFETKRDARYHVVEIVVDPSELILYSGATGASKIETHATTLGAVATRALQRVLRDHW